MLMPTGMGAGSDTGRVLIEEPPLGTNLQGWCRFETARAEAGTPRPPGAVEGTSGRNRCTAPIKEAHVSKAVTISLVLAVGVIVGGVAATSAAGSDAVTQGRSLGRTAPGAVGGEPAQPSPGTGTASPPCGTTVTNGTGPDASVGFTPCPDDEPPVIHPQVVEPTPGMADVHARPFDTATVRDDGRTVNVDFTSGVEPCAVLDHVDVSYGADAVTITLFEGHDPSAGEVACIEIGVFKRTIVTLEQPLDGRAIVDGAVGADRPA
jgi:hypothetical protein